MKKQLTMSSSYMKGPGYVPTNMDILEGIRITQGQEMTHFMMGFYSCVIVFLYGKGNFVTYLAIANHFGTFATKFTMYWLGKVKGLKMCSKILTSFLEALMISCYLLFIFSV